MESIVILGRSAVVLVLVKRPRPALVGEPLCKIEDRARRKKRPRPALVGEHCARLKTERGVKG